MKLSRNFVGGLVVLIVASSAVVSGLPAVTRKNSRRQMESTSAVVTAAEVVTPVVVSTTSIPTTDAKQASETEIGSIAPIGDLVENTKAPPTTVHTFIEKEVEALSSPQPAVTPAPNKVYSQGNVLPGLESSGPRPVYQGQGQGVGPGGPGPRPRPTTLPPPVSSTKKPDEEDDSSSEEDGEEVPSGPPSGDEDPSADDDDDDDEEVEDEEEDEEDEARKARHSNDQRGIVVEATNNQNRPQNYRRAQQPDALIPGYVSETGEIFVPIDTLEKVMPYSIIPDNTEQRGRLGYTFYRSDVDAEDEEDDDVSTDDDATTSEEADDDTSSAEDDDTSDEYPPIRISGFKVLYKQKEKPAVQEEDAEVQEAEGDETEDKEKPDEVEGPPVDPPSEEKNPALLTGQQPQFRPKPPLASVPATRPTNEDDENELKFRLRNRYLRRYPVYGISNLMSPYPQYYASYTDPRRPYFSYQPPQLNAGGYYF